MSVLVDECSRARDRDSIMAALTNANIEVRPFFTPLPLLAPYADEVSQEFPAARSLHTRGISIPSSANLDREQQDRVIAALRGDG